MNKIIMAILIVIILVAIYLAVKLLNIDYLIKDPVSLNIGTGTGTSGSTVAMGSIASTDLDSPSSTRYYYSGWVFIDSNFTKSGQDNVLFNRGTDFVASLNGSTLNIYAGNVAPTVSPASQPIGTISTSGQTPLLAIPNFPFQKWCYLVVNVDGNQVDVYVDGKFVSSANSQSPIGSTATNPITYGNQLTQGQMCRFSRHASAVSPQQVWQQYLRGSGQNKSLSKTGLKVEILKNGQTKVDQTIF